MTEIATDCAFCKIVAGAAPADVAHSSDRVLAFRDINPQAPTHLILIPKDHVGSAALLTDEHGQMLAEMCQTAAHLAEAERIDRTGWRFLTNVGPDAGQSVFHLHFHLLGGRRMRWPPG
jgi:histidine triad (HIT) family protein